MGTGEVDNSILAGLEGAGRWRGAVPALTQQDGGGAPQIHSFRGLKMERRKAGSCKVLLGILHHPPLAPTRTHGALPFKESFLSALNSPPLKSKQPCLTLQIGGSPLQMLARLGGTASLLGALLALGPVSLPPSTLSSHQGRGNQGSMAEA